VVCFSQVFLQKPCTRLSPPHPSYMSLQSQSSRFYHPQNIGWGVQIMELLITKFSPLPCYLVPLRPKNFSSTPYSQTPSACVPPTMSATKFHTHTKQQKKL
jgi:hypothetical protein